MIHLATFFRRERFTSGWHLVRVLQLLFGLFCLGDYFFFSGLLPVLALGGIVLLQAIFNWQLGCVNGSCRI